MSKQEHSAAQAAERRRKMCKDISKFAFNFSSSDSDDIESPPISKRGNSTKIQRLRMMKPDSAEKLSRKGDNKIQDGEAQFEQVIELRKSDHPRRFSHLDKQSKINKNSKQASSTEDMEKQKQKQKPKNLIHLSKTINHIFNIDFSSDEEKPTEKPFFNIKSLNPEEISRAELNENYRSDTIEENGTDNEENHNDNEKKQEENRITSKEEKQKQKCKESYGKNNNPLFPSQHVKTISMSLSQKIGLFKDSHNIKIFLMTPIPKEVVFEFQVHKYKNFMQTEYQLWLRFGQEMSLLAKAINNSLYLQKTVYKISCPTTNKKQRNKDIAFLVSDFKRQIYTLYDHEKYDQPGQNDKILCSIVSVPNYIGIKTEQVYVPGLEPNGHLKTIYNSRMIKNLKKLYAISENIPQIRKFKTCNASAEIKDRLKQEFKISKNTTRHAIIKNQEQKIIYGVFKVQKDRFRIKAGPTISPIHVLSHLVVHLD